MAGARVRVIDRRELGDDRLALAFVGGRVVVEPLALGGEQFDRVVEAVETEQPVELVEQARGLAREQRAEVCVAEERTVGRDRSAGVGECLGGWRGGDGARVEFGVGGPVAAYLDVAVRGRDELGDDPWGG